MPRPLVNGYYGHRMAKFGVFKDSYAESKIVQERMKNPDWEYFLLTDETPRAAFIQYLEANKLDYDPYELRDIISESYPVIISLKNYYNRPRPQQMNPEIQAAPSKTAQYPSYPSGHALQSLLLAEHLSRKYPSRRWDFFQIANRIADARVSVGLHYPSDKEFSKEIFQWMV